MSSFVNWYTVGILPSLAALFYMLRWLDVKFFYDPSSNLKQVRLAVYLSFFWPLSLPAIFCVMCLWKFVRWLSFRRV